MNRVTMCEVRSKEKMAKNKKKWIAMNPIWHRMKKCNPSSGHNDKLVHWWLLVYSSPHLGLAQGED